MTQTIALSDAAANGAKTKGLRGNRMTVDEAAKILNIKLPAKSEEINEVRKNMQNQERHGRDSADGRSIVCRLVSFLYMFPETLHFES